MFSRLLLVALAAVTSASGYPPEPKYDAELSSKRFSGASISYKETHICETTPGVKAYSGYVTLPNDLLSDIQTPDSPYDANIFFWYFESRNDPRNSPTSIYLGGGPGTSSFDSASGFPCVINTDSNSTTLNPFSWNNNVNMLYIDQPVGAGFSYSSIIKGTLDLLTSEFTPLGNDSPEASATTFAAAYSMPLPEQTVNTTASSVKTLWRFAQVWFEEFPEYDTSNDEISLWGNSYAGFFGPGFYSYVLDQNDAIDDGTHPDSKATKLNMATLGLTNACIDSLIEGPSYPEFAVNNTYGVEVYSPEVYEIASGNITACVDLMEACREASEANDPEGTGNEPSVNEVCLAATNICFNIVQGAYTATSMRSPFDISISHPTIFPTTYSIPFFNQRWVQEDLGVPVNFSLSSTIIPASFFFATGDPMRRDISSLEHVLDSGASVALVYGDLDYRCNWLGAEQISLAMDYPDSKSFHAAGYAPIQANSSYEGGVVRQHGKVSFSRVFEAGHSVTAYQPETVYRIFDRVMSGKDVSTGKENASDKYSSEGPSSSFQIQHDLPPPRESICEIYDIRGTCAENQVEAIMDGTAIVEDFIVVEPAPEVPDSEGAGGTGEGGSDKDKDSAAPCGAALWSSFGAVAILVSLVTLV